MNSPLFTLFIPTYNRAALLPRTFASIEAQTFRDFELVIVDDGSTDNTEAVVTAWQQRVDFPVRYVRQANQGKYAAHNLGVELARGTWFFLIDSDDRLVPGVLERILSHWAAIPEAERPHYAGVEGLVQSMDGQRILTTPYPDSPFDASYLDIFYRHGIGGDKKHALLTAILRRFPYPIFEGERHIRDSITWRRMAHEYRLRCVNEPFQQIEYQADGLSANRFRARMSSPRGFQLFYLEDITLHRSWLKARQLRRSTIDFIRYSLHLGQGFRQQGRLTGYNGLWILLYPAGIARWLIDLYRLHFKGGDHPNRQDKRN